MSFQYLSGSKKVKLRGSAKMYCGPPPQLSSHNLFVDQVLSGISHLASLDIIHGKIRFYNILITGAGSVKIGNLSACTMTGKLRGLGNCVEIETAAIPSLGLLCMEMMEPALVLLSAPEAPILEDSCGWSLCLR